MSIINFKMQVTPEQSKIVQKTLFDLGCYWGDNTKEIKFLDRPYLFISNNILMHSTDKEWFRNNNLNLLSFIDFCNWYEVKSELKKSLMVKDQNNKYYTGGDGKGVSIYWSENIENGIIFDSEIEIENQFKFAKTNNQLKHAKLPLEIISILH